MCLQCSFKICHRARLIIIPVMTIQCVSDYDNVCIHVYIIFLYIILFYTIMVFNILGNATFRPSRTHQCSFDFYMSVRYLGSQCLIVSH